jgi:hypothetical protein
MNSDIHCVGSQKPINMLLIDAKITTEIKRAVGLWGFSQSPLIWPHLSSWHHMLICSPSDIFSNIIIEASYFG